MAADPTLYQGAYRAAMSDSSISKPMVDAQGMQQLAEILRDAISNKKKGQGNYDKELQKVLDELTYEKITEIQKNMVKNTQDTLQAYPYFIYQG